MSTPSMQMVSTHNCVISPHLKDEIASGTESKYSRMFPTLPALSIDESMLLQLGRSGSVMDLDSGPGDDDSRSDNPCIPAGWPFYGQFIAHDITADRSLLAHHARLNQLRNFRTPRLDLEAVYGGGPSGEPFLFDINDPDKFLIGINDTGEPNDVPRNQQGVALIVDKRNDVHLFISQLHLAYLKFHNRVVDELRRQGTPADQVFSEAQRLVRWHHQWIVVHEFLPLHVGADLVQDILSNGLKFYSYDELPYIPVEFADAAYRYGHSQIRTIYVLNSTGAQGQVFPDCAGTCPVEHNRVVEWSYFFEVDPKRPPQASKRIDTHLAHAMINLPESVTGAAQIPEEKSLAYRDLERGRALDLPSGEAISRAMGIEPLTEQEIGLSDLGWKGETPLWYYILKESDVRKQGELLGPVGGRIVAEVLLGLLAADPTSFLGTNPDWEPTLPSAQPGQFTLADLLRLAS